MFEDKEDETPITLTINKSYANKYQTWREKEEKQKLVARYGSDVDDDSDDETEDDDANEWTNDVEKEFLRCYSILKKRDPSIYDASTKFFDKTSTDESTSKKTKEKAKKMNLKDAEIEFAFAEASKNDDEEEKSFSNRNNSTKSIVEEREEIKRSFKKALENDDDDDDLLKKKVKTDDEKAEEEENYIRWLKGQKNENIDASTKSDLSFLQNYWNDPSLSERDRFLRDFILNKMHKKPSDDDETKISSDEDEDEEEFDKAEEFERKFNFRFQEPDAEFLKRFPRTIDDSFRRKDDRRKLKRQEKKQRKELERKQRLEEIKRLKNLKKKEIFDKMKKLKTIAGDEDLPLNMDDLDGDFDPREYDRRMNELFNDDYYKKETNEETKPEVSDEELQIDKEPIDLPAPPAGKKKLNEIVKQSKPKFDPKQKSFEEYFDEYYKLDCEDFIGDLPVRFQYRQVEPNDFGLTIDEILNADDRELNAWCSLKKTSQYRSTDEETRDRHVFRNKAKNVEKKKKILSSVYQTETSELPEEENQSHSNTVETTTTTTTTTNEKTKKNKKKNKKRNDANLSNEQRLLTDMSDERLQIYGLNPKRFKNFVRFNKEKLSKE